MQKNRYPSYFYDSLWMLASVLDSALSSQISTEKNISNPSSTFAHNGQNEGEEIYGEMLMRDYVINKSFQGMSCTTL